VRLAISIFLFSVSALLADRPRVCFINDIPPQTVNHGSVLSFQVQSHQPRATFSYSVDSGSPSPKGQIVLNGFTGLFTYTPAPDDKFEFSLSFAASSAGNTPEAQSVLITPVTTLAPEYDLIEPSAAVPDPTSTDYLLISQSQNADQKLFNGIQRATWNVEISGKSVIFDGSSPSYSGLYTRFHNRPDMEAMTIYAETLTVRSPLRLPGTNVTVYARYLRFEVSAGQSSIDTTPLAYSARADQFQNGLNGQTGGNITLHIQSFYSQPGPTVRLVASGGLGQDAGQG